MDRWPVLSVQRPWSTWIAHGLKTVENRSWWTAYRGPLWIHAGKAWDGTALDFADRIGVEFPRFEPLSGSGVTHDVGSWHADDHPVGIVALVDLTGICEAGREFRNGCQACGLWAVHGQYHWGVPNARRLAVPVPARGRLGVWWPDQATQTALATSGVTG